MRGDIELPASAVAGREDGFDAVRAKYGEAMVARIRNYPRIAAAFLAVQGLVPGDPAYDDAIEDAEKAVRRAAVDRDYALDQAKSSATAAPRNEWDVVPTEASIKRGLDDCGCDHAGHRCDRPPFGHAAKAKEGAS